MVGLWSSAVLAVSGRIRGFEIGLFGDLVAFLVIFEAYMPEYLSIGIRDLKSTSRE
jgi:hypothetical protein